MMRDDRLPVMPLFVAAARSRNDDRPTSIAAGRSIAACTESHLALLEAFRNAPDGLTDDEAAERAGVDLLSCWWKRCSELRAAGYIRDTGRTRKGRAGRMRIVSEAVP